MPQRTHAYLFGRLNLIANYTDKQQYLLEGLATKQPLASHGFEWGFFEVQELESALGPVIYGYLVKYRLQSEEEVALPAEQRLTDEEALNRVRAKAPFFLHSKSGVIAYRPVGAQIHAETFRSRFCRLFEKGHEDLLVSAEIQSIQERLRLLQALRSFSSISRISISLHPSNPSNSRRWKRIDERIKDMNAASYREQFDAKPGGPGLKVDETSETVDKIVMADDGYGKASATGVIGSKVRTISTAASPLVARVLIEEDPSRVFDLLQPTLQEILQRTQS